jgi:hypothetical protein
VQTALAALAIAVAIYQFQKTCKTLPRNLEKYAILKEDEHNYGGGGHW